MGENVSEQHVNKAVKSDCVCVRALASQECIDIGPHPTSPKIAIILCDLANGKVQEFQVESILHQIESLRNYKGSGNYIESTYCKFN